MDSIENFMTTGHPFCYEGDDLLTVSRLMNSYNVPEVYVLNQDNVPVGMISDLLINNCSVVGNQDPEEVRASHCMHRISVIIPYTMSVERCWSVMENNKLRKAPVVDSKGKYCGEVFLRDLRSEVNDSYI